MRCFYRSGLKLETELSFQLKSGRAQKSNPDGTHLQRTVDPMRNCCVSRTWSTLDPRVPRDKACVTGTHSFFVPSAEPMWTLAGF